MKSLLTRRAAAEQLSISLSSLDRLRAEGELETIPVGRRGARITPDSVNAYVERQLVRARALAGRAGEAVEADWTGDDSTYQPSPVALIDQRRRERAERRARTRLETAHG